MYEPDGGEGQKPLKALLYGISRLYGGVQVMRRECYRRRWCKSFKLPCKVVSVGNLAVGGTGKTPMTAYLARVFQQIGQQVVVVCGGYKSRLGRSVHVVSDGGQVLLDSLQSGDEAQLLARQLVSVPVLIGRDRYRAGMAAVRQFQPDVVVLDDGFQHLGLRRDLDLVLLDDAAPFGNGHLLPRGILRESAGTLAAAGGIIFTRAVPGRSARAGHLDFLEPETAVFRSVHKPYHFFRKSGQSTDRGTATYPAVSHDFSRLRNAPVAAFSGIARNDDFQRLLLDNGAKPVSSSTFGDHHPYSRPELDRMAAEARSTHADFIVTTEKDFMRLPADFKWPLDLMVVGVEIDFGRQESSFMRFLHSWLKL